MFEATERAYLERARVGHLATADAEARPHVVPVCFALVDDRIVSSIDEKPQSVAPGALRRSRDIRENSRVALVCDHYVEDWSELGWVQVQGTAAIVDPGDAFHDGAVSALRAKYDQYGDHALEERPIIRIDPGSVRTWGTLGPSVGERTSAGE